MTKRPPASFHALCACRAMLTCCIICIIYKPALSCCSTTGVSAVGRVACSAWPSTRLSVMWHLGSCWQPQAQLGVAATPLLLQGKYVGWWVKWLSRCWLVSTLKGFSCSWWVDGLAGWSWHLLAAPGSSAGLALLAATQQKLVGQGSCSARALLHLWAGQPTAPGWSCFN